MTRNSSTLKKAARARQAATGENYTRALRAVTAEQETRKLLAEADSLDLPDNTTETEGTDR